MPGVLLLLAQLPIMLTILGLAASGPVLPDRGWSPEGRVMELPQALFLTAGLMAWQPTFAHLIFGVVAAACFFFPGLKYYLQRMRAENGK